MPRPASEERIRIAGEEVGIIDLVTQGKRAGEIARLSNGAVTVNRVREVIARHAAEIRSRATELVASRWVSYDQMLSRLIAKLYEDLLFHFDKDKAGAFVKLMERHARHLGSDLAQKKSTNPDEWMEGKDERQIKDWIKEQYGVDLDVSSGAPIPLEGNE